MLAMVFPPAAPLAGARGAIMTQPAGGASATAYRKAQRHALPGAADCARHSRTTIVGERRTDAWTRPSPTTLSATKRPCRRCTAKPSPAAIAKETDFIHPHYRAMIEASPFMAIASVGPEGLDATPRGDPPGFVHVLDDKTLLIPDRRGNNRSGHACATSCATTASRCCS